MPTQNKTIWTMWDRGADAAPDMVKLCVDSWRRHHPEWRVVVLDQGMVVESGTHTDLMRAGGLYRRLVDRQFSDRPPPASLARVK